MLQERTNAVGLVGEQEPASKKQKLAENESAGDNPSIDDSHTVCHVAGGNPEEQIGEQTRQHFEERERPRKTGLLSLALSHLISFASSLFGM